MKKSILFSVIVALLFLNFTCEDDKTTAPISNPVKIEILNLKKQEIVTYITGFSCNASVGCQYLVFGEKACGGPKEYLVFPTSVNLSFLTAKVNEYNALEKQYNIDNNIVSDCMAVVPPVNVGCVNGKCVIIP
jgi:hypothetical protein